MKSKYYFFAVLLVTVLAASLPGIAQTKYYIYSYDNSGNRVKREIDLTKSAVISNSNSSFEKEELIEEIAGDYTIKVFPNPTKGLLKVSISGLEGKMATVVVYTMTGKLVYNKTVGRALTEINLSGQPAGMYIMKVLVGQDTKEWKVIKD